VNRLSWYENTEQDRDFVIVGAGDGTRKYYQKIRHFIKDERLVTIGINKMTDFFIPDYHLWTNNQRLHDQRNCIRSQSKLMLGIGIVESLRAAVGGDYIQVNYKSEPGVPYRYIGGILYGHFRIAGVLAIAIAKVLGAKRIYAVGFDGFCLHTRKDLINGEGNQHCYGNGFTDDATYEQCIVKDKLTREGMQLLRVAGVNFNIITPTVHSKFFKDVMGILE